ncbi:MAG: hypothetical protein KTV16_16520 [Acidimicrobiia bacterium]|nr:hypothetical protein [Acidimicrobiia bacterium]
MDRCLSPSFEILALKLRSVRCDFDLTGVAQEMEGFSAAEVEVVALDTIRAMVRHLDKCVTAEHIAHAINRGEARRQINHHSQG